MVWPYILSGHLSNIDEMKSTVTLFCVAYKATKSKQASGRKGLNQIWSRLRCNVIRDLLFGLVLNVS